MNTQLKPEEKYLLVSGIQPIVDFYIDWKDQKRSDENVKSTYEGHIRTDYKRTALVETVKRDGKNVEIPTSKAVGQVWKNHNYAMTEEQRKMDISDYPVWLGERLNYPFSKGVEWASKMLDMPRSIFSNIFSRRLPEWGNVNETVRWGDFKMPLLPNILALNAFAHHDILTLPMGINQTVTTETLDTVEDATSRIPVVGNILGNVIKGFHSMLFGTSPSGFKIGGIDNRLDYYGDSMVGIMSAEMYYFYTGQYYKSINDEMRGCMPLNAFQYQSEDPLSTLLSATSNSTALNFKITDICETGIYDTSSKDKEQKRVGRIASALVNAPEVLRDVANARKDTTLAVKRLEAGTPHIDSALLSSSWLHSGIWQSFISTDSGWFGTLHFTVYRRKKRQKIISKTYTVHNFPLPVWYLMKNMLGKNGSGAGTIWWSHWIRGWLGRPTIASS